MCLYYMDLLCPANRPFQHHHIIKVWRFFFPCRSDMQDCPHQYTYPNMFLLQAPGRPFSCPVCSRRSAPSLSFTTVSSLIMDRSTWEGRQHFFKLKASYNHWHPYHVSYQLSMRRTFLSLSGLGIWTLCLFASCSSVSSMFFSFSRTYLRHNQRVTRR